MPSENPGGSPPPAVCRGRWWIDAVWLALLGACSAWWCLTATTRVGVTYDEVFYLSIGLETWRDWSDHKLAVNGVMPLPVEAVSLPLYAQELRSGTKIDVPLSHLRWSRMVTFGWLVLLLFSALRLGRAVGGPWAGRLAAGLIAADPNVLAHSSLATTDIPLTATLMAFTRAVYAGREGGWWRRLLLPGLWYGIAVLTKLSALLYGGIILVTLEIAYRFASSHLARPVGASVTVEVWRVVGEVVRSVLAVSTTIVLGICLAGVYCGKPEPDVNPLSNVANSMPESEPLRTKYLELATKYRQVPYTFVTFAFQWWQNSRGRPSFLNGTYYPTGCWFHFPVLIAMKLPIPIILLGLAALTRPRRIANPLSLVALLLLLSSMTANIQIGLRLVLPILTIAYVALAVAVIRGFGHPGWWAGVVAVVVMGATSAWVWPHGLCYLNQFSGGVNAAPDRVSDSNCDWGQGLPDLIAWYRANGEPAIAVWYFGSDPAIQRPPFQQIVVEAFPIKSGDDLRAAVGSRILAVGATVISLQPDSPPAKSIALKYLKTRMPLARTPTFILYDFRDPEGPPPRQ
jgi:hypothetical protein